MDTLAMFVWDAIEQLQEIREKYGDRATIECISDELYVCDENGNCVEKIIVES